MWVPVEYRAMIGYLCSALPEEQGGEPVPKGTGFFIGTFNSANERFVYLVTAKHVVEGLKNLKRPTYIRVNRAKQSPPGVSYIPLPLEGWLFHPDPSVDVAAMQWWPQTDDFHIGLMELDGQSLRGAKAYCDEQDWPWPPHDGQDVMFMGLMVHFYGARLNQPVVRRGSIALMPAEKIRGPYGSSDYYVVQAQVYPGNSGSPVWVQYDQDLFLLGLVSFGYPALEEIRQAANIPNGYYNLGLSLVVPIDKVVDVIDSPEERKRRDEGSEPDKQGVPVIDEEPSVFTRDDFQAALRKVSRRKPEETSESDQESSET